MVGTCSADGPGLMPTAIGWLFRGIAEQKSKTGARFSVRVSAVEVAGPGETLRDLLAPHATESEESPGVYLRDDPLLGTQLQNQSELRAPTAEKAAFYLDAALAARTDASSPDARFSHLLYTLHVYQYSVDRNNSASGRSPSHSAGSSPGVAGGRSRLHLIDLGSCQPASRTANSGQQQQQSSAMTLSGLGNVLVALFNGQRHLPYREHKVTQVLRECLGSLTCQAALVAHVAAASAYSETLATVQMASRVHRMRRRRGGKAFGNGAGSAGGSAGSGGSSEESVRLGGGFRSSGGETSGSADPSSSEQSCDTVIYVGPIDDATDGEHPPVYLPSLNSADQRCSMSRALRGSSVDHQRHHRLPNGIQLMPAKKATSADQLVPAAPPRSPQQVQRKALAPAAKCQVVQSNANGGGAAAEEQWIDGPRFNKSRISQALVTGRLQQQHPQQQQREMWVDGPPAGGLVAPTVAAPVGSAPAIQPTGYGFMDHHKQGMIRQWVETQSAQVTKMRMKFFLLKILFRNLLFTQQLRNSGGTRSNSQPTWIDAQPGPTTATSATPVKTLTVFKTCDPDDEEKEDDRPRQLPSVRPAPASNGTSATTTSCPSPRMNRPKYIAIAKASEPAEPVQPSLPVSSFADVLLFFSISFY